MGNLGKDKRGGESMTREEFESPTKKTKFHISDMDITFDRPLYQEEMERLFFNALRSIGVKGHRGCPD